MILRDTVEIAGESYRAQVGSASGASDFVQGEGLIMTQEVRAIIEPQVREWIPNGTGTPETEISWRGDVYVLKDYPLIFRRNGVDHHLTLRLERMP